MWTVLDEIHVFVVVADNSGGTSIYDIRRMPRCVLIGIDSFCLGEMRGPGKAGPAKQNPKTSAISSPRPQQVVKGSEPRLIAPQPSILPPLDDAEPQRSTVDSPRLDKGKSKAANSIASKAADSIVTQLKTWPMQSLITPSDDHENAFLGLDSPSDRGHDKELPWNFSKTSTPNPLRVNTILNGSVGSLSKTVEHPEDGTITITLYLVFVSCSTDFLGRKEKAEEPRKAVNGSSNQEGPFNFIPFAFSSV